MRKIVALLVISIALSGCAGRSIFEGGPSITATVANPIGRNELAYLENAYGVVLAAAVAYRRLPLCKRGQVETFSKVCARRDVILQLQAYDRKARAALLVARRFIRDNPTLSAVSALAAARAAVEDFRAAASSGGVV